MRSMLSRLTTLLMVITLMLPAAIVMSPTVWAGSDDFEIDEIDKVKRGKEHVQVRADVGKSGLICKIKIKYADGSVDNLDEIESNRKGVCEGEFDVPDRKSVVGDAIVKIKLETKKGDDRGKASRGFTVSDRRGS